MPRQARPPPLPLLACGTSAPRRPPFRGRTPPAFCHVPDGLGVRSVTPGPRNYPRGARDQDGAATVWGGEASIEDGGRCSGRRAGVQDGGPVFTTAGPRTAERARRAAARVAAPRRPR